MPGITAPQRARTSRTPSGLPNPPIILLTGPEKTGKSPQAALASASDAIGMTYWIQIGGTSSTADFYARTPGTRYEIVEHDGSFADICDAIRWAMAQPPRDDKRNMIVLDDVTALWDLLGDEVALMSRKRADRRAQANGRRTARLDDPYVDEDRDLWGHAKDRWGEVLWLLRRHTGPTLLIARQELITAYENDKPTRHTTRRIKAEKNLAAAVDAIVEFHAPGEAYVTGLHVMSQSFAPGKVLRYQGIDHLFGALSYRDAAPSRQVTESRPEAYLNEQQPQQPQQQRQAPAPQPDPELTGKDVVALVHTALNDSVAPEARLLDIREEWGTRRLRRTPVFTNLWGEMDANSLITRSLHFIQERDKEKDTTGGGRPDHTDGQEQAHSQRPAEDRNQDPQNAPAADGAPSTPPEPRADETSPHEPHPHNAAEPPTDDDAPPPPDPQADEPPADERPEEVSEAEEPQAAPSTPAAPAPRARRRNRGEELALKALHAEAEVQARIKMMTVGEHLGPISETGDPSLTVLRDHLKRHRPAIIDQLEQDGQTELADYYRNAPSVDPQIGKRFARYFEDAPAGK